MSQSGVSDQQALSEPAKKAADKPSKKHAKKAAKASPEHEIRHASKHEALHMDEEVTDLGEVYAAFADPKQEWRRLIAEVLGTFFLVLVAAGGPMVAHAVPGSVGRAAAVIAPGMMVMAIIMAFGKISGAHLNPGVSVAFALRKDFPWKRVPGYLVAQFVGAMGAAMLLQATLGVSASYGGNYPATGFTAWQATFMEAVLTFGLVTIILGTASGAQNIGIVGAVGVGGYIALAGMWASPISGASMNTFRTLGPNLTGGDLTDTWVYVVGPLMGVVLAVLFACLLRGPGGGWISSAAAQGDINVHAAAPHRP